MNEQVKFNWESHWKYAKSLESSGTIIGNWLRSRRLELVKKIVQDFSRSYSILDMGCGGGTTLQLFSNLGFKNLVGIDFSSHAVEHCKKLGYVVHFVDAKKTSFPDKSFDIVFEEGLWEHFSDPRPYIYECTRVSKKYILAIQPNHFTFFGRLMNIGWNILTKDWGGVKEYSFPMSYFKSFLKLYDFELKKSLHTLLHEQDVMLFERKK